MDLKAYVVPLSYDLSDFILSFQPAFYSLGIQATSLQTRQIGIGKCRRLVHFSVRGFPDSSRLALRAFLSGFADPSHRLFCHLTARLGKFEEAARFAIRRGNVVPFSTGSRYSLSPAETVLSHLEHIYPVQLVRSNQDIIELLRKVKRRGGAAHAERSPSLLDFQRVDLQRQVLGWTRANTSSTGLLYQVDLNSRHGFISLFSVWWSNFSQFGVIYMNTIQLLKANTSI
jgi:hypothetical protein